MKILKLYNFSVAPFHRLNAWALRLNASIGCRSEPISGRDRSVNLASGLESNMLCFRN